MLYIRSEDGLSALVLILHASPAEMEGYVVGFFGVALIVLGVLVLCTSVASLYITTSYFVAFPFGSPVWTGVLVSCA